MNQPLNPTDEQAAVLDAVATGEPVVVEALAGTGKTSTLLMVADQLGGQRALLTAYNRSIIDDVKAKLPRHVKAMTNHGLAYRSHGYAYKNAGKLGVKLTPRVLTDAFGWTDHTFGRLNAHGGAAAVIGTVNRYCSSDDDFLMQRHVVLPKSLDRLGEDERQGITATVHAMARQTWQSMQDVNDRLPATHDTYLKRFCIERTPVDTGVLLVDEAQDTTPAMLAWLVHQQRRAQVVIVGDSQQAIYGWRGAVNALANFPADQRAALTQSFRFGDGIAMLANRVLDQTLISPFRLRGLSGKNSRLGYAKQPRAILSRTNMGVLGHLLALATYDATARPTVVGGTAELAHLLRGCEQLMQTGQSSHPDLMGFVGFDDLVAYSETEAGHEYRTLVKVMTQYPVQALTLILDRAGSITEEQATVTLSTAHRAKGRQWSTVALDNDFPMPKPEPSLTSRDGYDVIDLPEEEGNLMYVAMTRAQDLLDIMDCEAAQTYRRYTQRGFAEEQTVTAAA